MVLKVCSLDQQHQGHLGALVAEQILRPRPDLAQGGDGAGPSPVVSQTLRVVLMKVGILEVENHSPKCLRRLGYGEGHRPSKLSLLQSPHH